MFNMFRGNRKGFTLVELIVVIVVLGVLAAIAIPRYNDYVTQAKYSALMADIKTVENTVAAMQMSDENNALPVVESHDNKYDEATALPGIGDDLKAALNDEEATVEELDVEKLSSGLKNAKKAAKDYFIITSGDLQGTVFLKEKKSIKPGVITEFDKIATDRNYMTGLEDLLPETSETP